MGDLYCCVLNIFYQARHPRHWKGERSSASLGFPQLQDKARGALYEHSQISIPCSEGISFIKRSGKKMVIGTDIDIGGQQAGDHICQPRRLYLLPAPQFQEGGWWEGH